MAMIIHRNITMRRARKLHRVHCRQHGPMSFRRWARCTWPPQAAHLMCSPKLARIVRGQDL